MQRLHRWNTERPADSARCELSHSLLRCFASLCNVPSFSMTCTCQATRSQPGHAQQKCTSFECSGRCVCHPHHLPFRLCVRFGASRKRKPIHTLFSVECDSARAPSRVGTRGCGGSFCLLAAETSAIGKLESAAPSAASSLCAVSEVSLCLRCVASFSSHGTALSSTMSWYLCALSTLCCISNKAEVRQCGLATNAGGRAAGRRRVQRGMRLC